MSSLSSLPSSLCLFNIPVTHLWIAGTCFSVQQLQMAFPKTTVRNGIIIIIHTHNAKLFLSFGTLLPLWGCMLITARRCSPLVPRVAECTEMFGWKMWDLILFDHGHKNRIFTNVVERNALKPPYIVILFWKSPQNIYFTVLSQGFNLNVFTQEDYLCSSFHVRVQRAILCNADDSVDWVVSSGELRSHNDFSRSLS